MSRTGVYPGSFNPPTLAHLAIAAAALDAFGLERLDLVVSRVALEKEHVDRPLLEHRIAVVQASVAHLGVVGVIVSEHRLIVDIAQDYDIVVMGADKWQQVNDPAFYGGDATERDAALRRLPRVAVAPRPPFPLPDDRRLVVPRWVEEVSSTGARAGRAVWMTDAARDFDQRTGAWSDPARYERWLSG